jgi:hypothetical protein
MNVVRDNHVMRLVNLKRFGLVDTQVRRLEGKGEGCLVEERSVALLC